MSDFISFTNAGVSETNATRGVPFILQICRALLIQRTAAFLARTGLFAIMRMCKTISGFAPFKAQLTAAWTVLDGDMIARISSPNVFGLACNESGNPKSANAAAFILG